MNDPPHSYGECGTAIDAISADGRYGALCSVAARDVKKAAKVLGAE